VTDIEFCSDFTGAQVLAALSFLTANKLFNTFDVCDRARIFQSTAAGFAFSRQTCCINSLANFFTVLSFQFFRGYAATIAFAP